MTFRITAPGIYVTRDGSTVEIRFVDADGAYGVHDGDSDVWQTDGSYFSCRSRSELDIVATASSPPKSVVRPLTTEEKERLESIAKGRRIFSVAAGANICLSCGTPEGTPHATSCAWMPRIATPCKYCGSTDTKEITLFTGTVTVCAGCGK